MNKLSILLLSSFFILCIAKSPCTVEDIARCPSNSVCKISNGVSYCDCTSGFIKINGVCIDVNECLVYDNPCQSPAECINTPGSYHCQCPTGYKNLGVLCIDIDECSQALCDGRPGVGKCTNYKGTYACGCHIGYKLAGDNRTCIDINECAGDAHGCTEKCVNTEGSFECSCQLGMKLLDDGKTCAPSTPCSNGGDCSYKCSRIDGVDTCICRNGYQLDSNGKCIDIDECTTLKPCDPHRGICLNTVGSFACLCSEGFILGPDNSCRNRDGGWTDWTPFLQCNQSCNGGQTKRFRFCENPFPVGLGSVCKGVSEESLPCNTQHCPLTEDEKKFGFEFFVEGLTTDELYKLEDLLLASMSKTMNDYCLSNNANLRVCCSSQTTQIPNNMTKPLLEPSNVLKGDGFPRVLGKDLHKMLIIFSFPKSHFLCSTGIVRKKRALLQTTDSAVNPTAVNTAFQDKQFYLTQKALEDAVLRSYNDTRTVKVYKEKDEGFPWWGILLIILACILFLILLILLLWFICKRCCHKNNRIGSARDKKDTSRKREDIMMKEKERKRKEKEEKRKEKERRRREKEEEKAMRENKRKREIQEEEQRRREEEERRRREEEEYAKKYGYTSRENDSGRSRDQTSAGRSRTDQYVKETNATYRPPYMTDFDEDLDVSSPKPTNRFNIPDKVNPLDIRNPSDYEPTSRY